MAIDFREGYEFFQKNAGALFGADIATEFGTSTVNYVETHFIRRQHKCL